MKILPDECVPIQLRNAFLNHEVQSATTPSWKGLSNGQLLDRAEQEGFGHQQDLSTRHIAILELWTNHRPTLDLHFDYIRMAAERIAISEYVQLRQP